MDQSLWDRQIALEAQPVTLGHERYERGLDDESASLPGKTLMYDNIQLVTEAIETWITKPTRLPVATTLP